MTLPKLHTLRQANTMTGIGIGTLRTAIKRGQLSCTRIGGKVFVTESQLAEMINQCQHTKKGPDCTSDGEKAVNRSGSSETDNLSTAQVAALAKIEALRKRSPNTSRASTSRSHAKAN